MKCINDINKLQIAATTDEMLERRTRQFALDDQSIAAVKKLFSHVMDHAGIRDLIGRVAPQCMPIFEFWDETPAGRLDLTSVGIAIGSGRVEKALGEKFDLSIWIN